MRQIRDFIIKYLELLNIDYKYDALGIYFIYKSNYKIIIYPDGIILILKTIDKYLHLYKETKMNDIISLNNYLNNEFKIKLRNKKMKNII